MSNEQTQGKLYHSDEIDVTFDGKRCIHVGRCVRGLPAVFDTDRRPWILPANGSADEVAAVVERCPSGALQYRHKDGGDAEQPDEKNRITPRSDGPLWLRGDISVRWQEGAVEGTRFALCRCGMSDNKPFCDNGHRIAQFEAGSGDERETVEPLPLAAQQPLTVEAMSKGPLMVSGDFEIVNGAGETIFAGDRAKLCRCGASSNKPFCDGTHKKIDFG